MPGLAFERLPATQQNPIGMLQGQLRESEKRLQSGYSSEVETLKRQSITDKQFYGQLGQINRKYQGLLDQERNKVNQQTQQIRQVQALINSGQIDPDAGNEAMMRMVLPPETERAMFRKEPQQPQPFSITQIMSPTMLKSIEDFAEAAPAKREFWKRRKAEPKLKEGLLQQYMRWRDLQKYDNLNYLRQSQLDLQWDSFMAGDEKYNTWWHSKEKRQPIVEVRSLRKQGKIGQIMRGRLVGAPIAKSVSPIGESVERKKTKPAPMRFHPFTGMQLAAPEPEEVIQPTAEQLQRQNTQEAFEYGRKLGYW